jgi:hypothetical protein
VLVNHVVYYRARMSRAQERGHRTGNDSHVGVYRPATSAMSGYFTSNRRALE